MLEQNRIHIIISEKIYLDEGFELGLRNEVKWRMIKEPVCYEAKLISCIMWTRA